MNVIREPNCYEQQVERSRFIALVRHIESPEDAKKALLEIKKTYPKARHYCYAYLINNVAKSSDDGEPSGTAGRPLLELLKVQELDEVLIVVVRYFGGVLLGAARLLRTYVDTATQVLKSSPKYKVLLADEYLISSPYALVDGVKSYLKKHSITFLNIQMSDQAYIKCQSVGDFQEDMLNCFHKRISISWQQKQRIYQLWEESNNE